MTRLTDLATIDALFTEWKRPPQEFGTSAGDSRWMQPDAVVPFALGSAWPRSIVAGDGFRRQNELILQAAGEGIYGLDLDGRVTFANPAAARMTGHTIEELIGRSMHDLVHHSTADGLRVPRQRCAIYAAFRDGAVHRDASDVFWRKDGRSFPVEYSSTPIKEDGRLIGAVVVFRDITERVRSEQQLRAALEEVKRLKERLQDENALLRREIATAAERHPIVGSCDAFRAALRAAERVAPTDATVLIQGESGTGKELIARAVHERSGRRDQPMIPLNCGALPPTLVQSELFGHERGAFTGALARRRGRFELADGGTLFLDEVAELPLETQATLLRVLQEGEFERVGGSETVRVNVRVIAATHQDLAHMVEGGRFRADLYYRLNVFPIRLPPLRERRRDIPQLVQSYLERLSKRLGRTFAGVTEQSMQRLMRYSFPGNVRELHNVLERAAILASGAWIEVDALVEPPRTLQPALKESASHAQGPSDDGGLRLATKERSHITSVLRTTGWKIAGDDGAARVLGLHPNTLRSRMKRLGIPTRSDNRRAASE